MRDPLQVRGKWTPLTEFETPLAPDFDGEIVNGPNVVVYLIVDDDGRWQGDIDFAAHIASERCDESSQMCAGTPAGFSPRQERLGSLEGLQPVR